MSENPYRNAPDYRFWRKSVAPLPLHDVDPVVANAFGIQNSDKVATAGSCFAQHMARHLSMNGFSYFVTEPAHPTIPPNLAAEFNCGIFSARYGNIYTARQLLQLLRRAYGQFVPIDDCWVDASGSCFDPFRPQIQKGGFANRAEFGIDREKHLGKVRQMVEQMDVFVFTLGLTEAWIDDRDGAVYPICPGTAAGTFDPGRHKFRNFRVHDVIEDMSTALKFIRDRNPAVKFILTVSPVPLVATAEDRHVVVSNTYSKSCLRVACEEVVAAFPDCEYFPSYEIITGNFTRGMYFADDLRSVTEPGVQHVMNIFMRHYASPLSGDAAPRLPPPAEQQRQEQEEQHLSSKAYIATVCDEEALASE